MSSTRFKPAQSSAPVVKRLYVIDTSYLLELYRVEGDYEEQAHLKIKERFQSESSSQFFVPVAVLFELANHIADAHRKNFCSSQRIAKELQRKVQESLARPSLVTSPTRVPQPTQPDDQEKLPPWIITYAAGCSTLEGLMDALSSCVSRFSEEFAANQLGLTDTAVVLEAQRLRQQNKSDSSRQYKIHIWTRHAALKAHEPDAEDAPFIGLVD